MFVFTYTCHVSSRIFFMEMGEFKVLDELTMSDAKRRSLGFPSILDFEASGFGVESYPIEVGVVVSSGERYCALICPHREWHHWSKDAHQLHGIDRSTLVELGKPVAQVCTDLNALLKESTVYSDGWTQDQPWLITLYHAAAMVPTFRLSPIEGIATEQQLMCWDDTKQQVQRNMGVLRHRASSDALIIQQTFIESRREAESIAAEAASSLGPLRNSV